MTTDHEPTNRPSLPDGLLLECVVTSLNADGGVHVSPMGPIVDQPITRALLRPYPPSCTLDNLRRTRRCVMHVTDDVLLIARAALGLLTQAPDTWASPSGKGAILVDACRWYELELAALDEESTPHKVDCVVVDQGSQREFVGLNRAKHAVVEATILATRLDYLPHADIVEQLRRLAPLIEKTGGREEHEAFSLVEGFVVERVGGELS